MLKRLIEFLKDTRAELAKVSWPTRPELRESTIVVIVTVFIITIFVGVVDQGFNFLMKMILRGL
jgi:preprotein translocase subunit SecE